MWLRCCKSTVALFRRSPDNFLPKYLWFCPSCNTSIISPPISRNMGSFKFCVVKILVLEVFKCKPAAASSSTKLSTILARSVSLLAYNIKSSAQRTFVSNSSSAQWSPQCWTRSFHFLIAYSKPALNSSGLRTSPCFTPRLIGNVRPCTTPTWSWYNEAKSFKYACGTPCTFIASNKALYSIRSKAFRKSKLAHHIGTDHSIDLEQTFSKTAKASSTPAEERNPTWSFDCWASNIGFTRV